VRRGGRDALGPRRPTRAACPAAPRDRAPARRASAVIEPAVGDDRRQRRGGRTVDHDCSVAAAPCVSSCTSTSPGRP
jgi:hypothetical protein